MDCLFCQIAAKNIPAKIVYEDEHVVAFEDIAPRAPHHILLIPKQHIASLNDLTEATAPVAAQLLLAAQKLAKELGIAERGYRTVFNCNQEAGQTVFHLHLHLLGGRLLGWPPG
jgi:histidine triad (HIT) family protein